MSGQEDVQKVEEGGRQGVRVLWRLVVLSFAVCTNASLNSESTA